MNRRRLWWIAIAALLTGSLVSLKVYSMLRAQSGPAKDLVDFLVAAYASKSAQRLRIAI